MANKFTKIQVLHSNFDLTPSLDVLDNGVIAINNRLDKEKIYFRGENESPSKVRIVEFDTTKNIMKLVDQKIQDTDIGGLQNDIDIINGGDNVNGSFAYADKALENKLRPLINDKIQTINGTKGVNAVTILDANNNKSVTIEALVRTNDLILAIDDVSGITSTLKLSIVNNTIFLTGRNDVQIGSVTVPGMNLTFGNTDAIDLTNIDGNVSANLKLDANTDNRLKIGKDGLFSSKIINCGKY